MRNYYEVMFNIFGDRYNKYRNLYEDDLNMKLEFPLQIDLDLRDMCNLKCSACHTISRNRINKLIDKKLLMSIIDECKANNLCAVNIGGCSEPLIDKELCLETIGRFKEAGVMDIFLHTNGVLMDNNFTERLVNSGITYLCISIDAATNEIYRKVRGRDFNKLIKNINYFLKTRGKNNLPVLRVSFLPTAVNISEKDKFIDYWTGRADIVEIQDYVYVDGGPKKAENVSTDEDKIRNSFASRIRGLKRMAIVAPNLLYKSCGPDDVNIAIENNYTFEKYNSISEYWNSISGNLLIK